MTKKVWELGAAVAFVLVACTPKAQPGQPETHEVAVSDPVATGSVAPTTASAPPLPDGTPREIAKDEPLSEGLVSFQGMVLGAKEGFDIRGVIFEFSELRGALPDSLRDQKNDELLGSKLRVVAVIRSHHSAPQDPAEPQLQMRSGDWWSADGVRSVELVAPAVMIEGVVGRSKGLFTVGKHMVSREDLSWPFKGADVVGKEVRLWGQPRTYVCPPQAQCLIEGAIPMFDVARGELP
ncbi:MAG: hypothetical protein H6718_28675 [Polyangiaceae bacterium]|nr:hypothetical protein [Myxococcales bacterium]MCB9589423.1 hypothetical protein [Polyangiaceae bacterium]